MSYWPAYLVMIVMISSWLYFLWIKQKKKNEAVELDEKHRKQIGEYNSYLRLIQLGLDEFGNIGYCLKEQLEQVEYLSQNASELLDQFVDSHIAMEASLDTNSLNSAKNWLTEMDKLLNSLFEVYTELEELIRETKNINIDIEREKYFSTNKFRKEGNTSGEHNWLYFNGCKTKEDVNRKYRALVKMYHPDSKTGNAEIFMQIEDERERILKVMNNG